MTEIAGYILPFIFAAVLIFSILKKRDTFDDFTEGVVSGGKTILSIFPSLFALVVSVGMLKASGFLSAVGDFLAPVSRLLGFPPEVMPLVLIRPFSGSGATAIYENILKENGPDSFSGLVASVITGSSETLFYVVAIYFSAAKIKKTRYTVPAAMIGDLTVFILAGAMVSLLIL